MISNLTKFTVIGLSETWLHSLHSDIVDLYRSIRVTRPSQKGGRVPLYVRNSLEYTVLSE